MSEIYFAGGCFWGTEKLFASVRGVTSTCCGYAGGDTESPTYEAVCAGDTGHRETVRVAYDPTVVPLERLLFIFFAAVDTTVTDRQAHDVGSQYQSGIYYCDEQSKAVVLRIAAIERAVQPFCVELAPLRCFYAAEEYHQKYLDKNPDGYCHIPPAELFALSRISITPEQYTAPAKSVIAAGL